MRAHPNESIAALAARLSLGEVVVVAGAGMSTDSGIPDYRGPSGTLKTQKPMTIGEFLRSDTQRRRYWARSAIGWPFVASRAPNDAHVALAALEDAGLVTTVITQNVDGLHQRAGSRNVIELHGALRDVVCLECGDRSGRAEVQRWIDERNVGWDPGGLTVAPDGDVHLSSDLEGAFVVPTCPRCGGILKPDVVFFGEHVPSERVAAAYAAVDAARTILVLGSSLTVWSGFRFVERAARGGTLVAIVNRGATRADSLAQIRVDASLAPVMHELLHHLGVAAFRSE